MFLFLDLRECSEMNTLEMDDKIEKTEKRKNDNAYNHSASMYGINRGYIHSI